MMNLNAMYSPYNNIRPKSFFAQRKRMISEDIAQGSGGKSYNPNWNMGRSRKATTINKSSRTSYIPGSLYFFVVLVSIIVVM